MSLGLGPPAWRESFYLKCTGCHFVVPAVRQATGVTILGPYEFHQGIGDGERFHTCGGLVIELATGAEVRQAELDRNVRNLVATLRMAGYPEGDPLPRYVWRLVVQSAKWPTSLTPESRQRAEEMLRGET